MRIPKQEIKNQTNTLNPIHIDSLESSDKKSTLLDKPKELTQTSLPTDSFENNEQTQKRMQTITQKEFSQHFQNKKVFANHENIIQLKKHLSSQKYQEFKALLPKENQSFPTHQLFQWIDQMDTNGSKHSFVKKGVVLEIMNALESSSVEPKKAQQIQTSLQKIQDQVLQTQKDTQKEKGSLQTQMKQKSQELEQKNQEYGKTFEQMTSEQKKAIKDFFGSLPIDVTELSSLSGSHKNVNSLKETLAINFLSASSSKGWSALGSGLNHLSTLKSFVAIGNIVHKEGLKEKTLQPLFKKRLDLASELLKLEEKEKNIAFEKRTQLSKELQSPLNQLQKLLPKETQEAKEVLPKLLQKRFGLEGLEKHWKHHKEFYQSVYLLSKLTAGHEILSAKKELPQGRI